MLAYKTLVHYVAPSIQNYLTFPSLKSSITFSQIRLKLYSSWRNDEKLLKDFFKACALNWKLYRGPRTQKQANKVYALYKQATVGDCTDTLEELEQNRNFKKLEWLKMKGTPLVMAKRRFITFLAEIDPNLIHVNPTEKPPGKIGFQLKFQSRGSIISFIYTEGFPLDENGAQICAKCNTNVGCARPLLDDHNIDLRRQLFEVEEFHDPVKLAVWCQNSIRTQRCIFGVHKPISKFQSLGFMEWFSRPDNNGFMPYDNVQLYNIIRDFLNYVHEIAYDMQLHKDEYSQDELNEQAGKALRLAAFYEQLSGVKYEFEAPCTRDVEVCNQRREADGQNHMHVGECATLS